MLDFLSQPWPWYVSGFMIALVMLLLLLSGGEFGVSGNLRTLCSISGASRFSDFFRFDWKSQLWNLVFVFGAIVGGFISSVYLTTDTGPTISTETIQYIQELGLDTSSGLAPANLFHRLSLFNVLIWSIGGMLVGFGTRYAGGCTSGHAISGLANFQLPSLYAVLGFFTGGVCMTYFVLPLIF